MLLEKLRQDLKESMKAHDAVKKSVVQMLISGIRNFEIDTRTDITSDEEIKIVNRELKQTKESLDMAKKVPEGHEDLIEEFETKIKILQSYLPEQMSEEEVEKIVRAEVEKLGLSDVSMQQKGIVMKNIMPLLRGKADGKVINDIVTKVLS